MFSKLKKASKKWHRRAWMIDPKKTTLIFDSGYARSAHVPSWIYKKELSQDVKEVFHSCTRDYPQF
jgi:hypothetical protein